MPSTHRSLCEDERADVKECLLGQKRVRRTSPFAHLLDFALVRSFDINTCINTGQCFFLEDDFQFFFVVSRVKKNLPFPEDPLIDGYNWPSFKYLN